MKNKNPAFLEEISRIVILFILGFYALSVIIIQDKTQINYAFVLGILFTGLLVYALSRSISDLWSDWSNIIMIAITSIILLSVYNKICVFVPTSDYEVLWKGAQQIVEGTFWERAIRKDDYFCFYNYQIGYTFYLSLIYRLFHGSLRAAKIIKIAVMTSTNVILYKTLRLFLQKKAAAVGTLLYICYPFVFMGAGILNNQHEAMLLESLAIFIFLRKDQVKSKIFSAIIIAVANVLRPTASIVLIAMIIMSFFQWIVNKRKKYLLYAVLLAVTYLISANIMNYLFIITNLAPYGIKSDNLWFKITLGLTGEGITKQPTIDAEHTNYYYDLLYYNFDYERYNTEAARYITDMFKNKSINMDYILKKIITFSGDVDNQHWSTGNNFLSSHSVLVNTLNGIGIYIYFLTIMLSFVRCLTNNIVDQKELLLPVLVFSGYFLVYIIFEVQTRYRYEQYYMLFMMGTPSLAMVFERMMKLRKINENI